MPSPAPHLSTQRYPHNPSAPPLTCSAAHPLCAAAESPLRRTRNCRRKRTGSASIFEVSPGPLHPTPTPASTSSTTAELGAPPRRHGSASTPPLFLLCASSDLHVVVTNPPCLLLSSACPCPVRDSSLEYRRPASPPSTPLRTPQHPAERPRGMLVPRASSRA